MSASNSRQGTTVTAASSSVSSQVTICRPAPFCTDAEAIETRARCDYEQRINLEDARAGNAPRLVRVYADGVYDLFHQGHARQLMQAKNLFPNIYLMAGVCSDTITHKFKGRTVMNEDERYDAVRHCRYVDEVILDAPWELTDEFLAANKIDFVAHDAIPYGSEDCEDLYASVKKRGMFVATERTEGVSTSDVVARIVKDYDLYVRRNLSRGYSARDLNVSYLNEKKFKLQNKMDELKQKGKRVVENIGEVKGDILSRWEEKQKEFIDNFLLMFRRKRLAGMWNSSKGRIMQALSPTHSPDNSPANSESGDDDEDRKQRDDDGLLIDMPPAAKRQCLTGSPAKKARQS